jgi:hypothetical protein
MNQRFSVFGTIVLRFLGGWTILHGILTCLNSFNHAERWSSPAYEIVSIVPPYIWGTLLIIGGLLVLYASYKGADYSARILSIGDKEVSVTYSAIKNVGLWIIAAWFLTIAIGFTVAASGHLDVSLAAGSRDFFIAVLAVILTKSSEAVVVSNKE